LATGNCGAAGDVPVLTFAAAVLVPLVRGVELESALGEVRPTTRDAGVGEVSATGRPGVETSDVVVVDVVLEGSEST